MTSTNEDRLTLMKRLDESFREVRRLILAEWNRVNEHGLGMTHGKMLIVLAEKGPQKASSLAEALFITGGGVTGIADRLIELGYVTRERSEQDRRSVLLQLTNEGQAMVKTMMDLREKVMLKLFRGMSSEDMCKAIELFGVMSRNMECGGQGEA
ncbi:MarR family winged helix-turn-helix transcriptional regulator [Paenibacillus soyae]|uniref:MarR family transcriptional regulator n=1 Tax=Paenibacillus soyae TaxID=2969249 RepID=A0A9X2MQ59_9BACL|nr:MarR family transcriptional regulator [Paenibacillus soyae]MCR2804834.1 MarR family transcriptional regulator [Paenibacillus soyae]